SAWISGAKPMTIRDLAWHRSHHKPMTSSTRTAMILAPVDDGPAPKCVPGEATLFRVVRGFRGDAPCRSGQRIHGGSPLSRSPPLRRGGSRRLGRASEPVLVGGIAPRFDLEGRGKLGTRRAIPKPPSIRVLD